jgi:ribosomal protein S15P/S13E
MEHLKSKVSFLIEDNEYYLMAKDEARQTIKEQEALIAVLQRSAQELKEHLAHAQQDSLSARGHGQAADRVQLLEIENSHLQQELHLNNHFGASLQQLRQACQAASPSESNRLVEENRRLRAQLKGSCLEKIHADIYSRTLEQCTLRVTALQQENNYFRSMVGFDCQSASKHSQPSEQSDFDFRLDSHPSQRSATSPSEAECVWKHDPDCGSAEHLNSLDGLQINTFDVRLGLLQDWN